MRRVQGISEESSVIIGRQVVCVCVSYEGHRTCPSSLTSRLSQAARACELDIVSLHCNDKRTEKDDFCIFLRARGQTIIWQRCHPGIEPLCIIIQRTTPMHCVTPNARAHEVRRMTARLGQRSEDNNRFPWFRRQFSA